MDQYVDALFRRQSPHIYQALPPLTLCNVGRRTEEVDVDSVVNGSTTSRHSRKAGSDELCYIIAATEDEIDGVQSAFARRGKFRQPFAFHVQ